MPLEDDLLQGIFHSSRQIEIVLTGITRQPYLVLLLFSSTALVSSFNYQVNISCSIQIGWFSRLLAYSKACCTHTERLSSASALILNILVYLHDTILTPRWYSSFIIIAGKYVSLWPSTQYNCHTSKVAK